MTTTPETTTVVKCACQHCDYEKSPKSKYCYSCNYIDSCHKEVWQDYLFRRGYYADK